MTLSFIHVDLFSGLPAVFRETLGTAFDKIDKLRERHKDLRGQCMLHVARYLVRSFGLYREDLDKKVLKGLMTPHHVF